MASITALVTCTLFLAYHVTKGSSESALGDAYIPYPTRESDHDLFSQFEKNVSCVTKARQLDPAHLPIQGLDIQLVCVTEPDPGGCSTTTESLWSRGGAPITDSTHNVTKSVLTIKGLKEEYNGNYTCKVPNCCSETGQYYNLKVKPVPSVKLTLASPTPPRPVTGNDNVTLTCETNVPHPTYEWSLNNTIFSPACARVQAGKTCLYVIESPSHKHMGLYECNVTNAVVPARDFYQLTVFSRPEGKPRVQPSTSTILAGSPWPVHCDGLALTYLGNPAASRYEWRWNDTAQSEESVEYVLRPESVTDGGHVTCAVRNYYGYSDQSDRLDVRVHAPVRFEPREGDNDTLYIRYEADAGGTHSFSVNVSGTEVTSYGVSRPGGADVTGDFPLAKNETLQGDFLFGQTAAWEWTFSWTVPKSGSAYSCDDLTFYSGLYDLTAGGRAAGNHSQDTLQFKIDATFGPAWRGPDVLRVAVGQHDVRITCSICMNPAPTEYNWIYESTKLPPGVENESEQALLIRDFKEGHYGKYSCQPGPSPNTSRPRFVIKVSPNVFPVGMLVGIVVGSLVVVVLVTVLVVCLVKRRRRASASDPEAETHSQTIDELAANKRASKQKKDKDKKKVLPTIAEVDGSGRDNPGSLHLRTLPPPPVPAKPPPAADRPYSEHIYELGDEGGEIYDDTDVADGEDYLNLEPTARENHYVQDGPRPPWRR